MMSSLLAVADVGCWLLFAAAGVCLFDGVVDAAPMLWCCRMFACCWWVFVCGDACAACRCEFVAADVVVATAALFVCSSMWCCCSYGLFAACGCCGCGCPVLCAVCAAAAFHPLPVCCVLCLIVWLFACLCACAFVCVCVDVCCCLPGVCCCYCVLRCCCGVLWLDVGCCCLLMSDVCRMVDASVDAALLLMLLCIAATALVVVVAVCFV